MYGVVEAPFCDVVADAGLAGEGKMDASASTHESSGSIAVGLGFRVLPERMVGEGCCGGLWGVGLLGGSPGVLEDFVHVSIVRFQLGFIEREEVVFGEEGFGGFGKVIFVVDHGVGAPEGRLGAGAFGGTLDFVVGS